MTTDQTKKFALGNVAVSAWQRVRFARETYAFESRVSKLNPKRSTRVITDCWKIKNCAISFAIASNAAAIVRSCENCIERVELSLGFAVMEFVFAGSVFTSRYLRLNKGHLSAE